MISSFDNDMSIGTPCGCGTFPNDRSRGSIRQIEKFAPAVGADVALHHLTGSGRPKQTASGAGQPVFWAVLIFGVTLRHLLLRKCRRDRAGEDRARERRPYQRSPI
jgi:hypothetical protein